MGNFGTKARLVCPKTEIEAGDAVAFAREKLGFNPDEKQMAMLRGGVATLRPWSSAPSDRASADLG
jgi:hypothetical protein